MTLFHLLPLLISYCCFLYVETTINGEPIINLPPKTIKLQKVDFTKEERAFYLTLEERSRQQFKVG